MPSDNAKRHVMPFRIAQPGLDAIDEARGAWSRSEYIRRAVAKAIREGMKGPREPDW